MPVLAAFGALVAWAVPGSVGVPLAAPFRVAAVLAAVAIGAAVASRVGLELRPHGRGSPVLRVSCHMQHPERAKEVSIEFEPGGKSGTLRICGGPNNDIRFRIEVPKNTNLYVRSPAGDVSVSGVVGDKDVEIHAGDLTISVGDAADYKHADASVYAGDLSASAFGVNKEGLFRSFDKDNPNGKFRLHAHVGAGDLVLR